MNRNTIIAVIVIIIIVLGAWYWFASAPAASQNNGQAASTTDQTVGVPGGGTTSLRTLATQGGNYTCNIETVGGGQHTTGTVYSSGGKTRFDLIVSNAGTDVRTHIIRSGGYSYTWVDGQVLGTKAIITSSTPIVEQPQGGVIQVTDTTNMSSECHPWSPDLSQFVPPVGITF